MPTAWTFFTLILGALGALLVIFLKEAAQHAIQRRTIAWQLYGYTLLWKKQVLRNEQLFAMYQKVQDRQLDLRSSLAHGTSAFTIKHQEQSAARDEVRRVLREAIVKATNEANPAMNALHETTRIWSHVLGQLTQQRKDLLDGKTFISDRDAAVLGRSFAFDVVQFRASLQTIFMIAESFLAVIQLNAEDRANVVAELVDQLVLHGEAFFESLSRLDQGVNRLSRLPLWKITWATLID